MSSYFNFESIAKEIIEVEKKHQDIGDCIWSGSPYYKINELKINNVGIVGEHFVSELLKKSNIECHISGSSSKNKPGDGFIKNKSVELKTARIGKSKSFQHELGEHPWLCDYIILVDFTPKSIFITIIKNFTKDHYLSIKRTALPYFNKTITRRKEIGSYKLTVNQNDINNSIINENTIEVEQNTTIEKIFCFFNTKIL